MAWTGDQIIVYDALGERSMLVGTGILHCKHLVTGGTEQRQFMVAGFDKPRLKPGYIFKASDFDPVFI